jgi:hypothetical protein
MSLCRRAWLLFLAEIPASRPALRVRVWRRLRALKTVRVSTGAFLLPEGDDAREDFDWLGEEIRRGGGKALVAKVDLVEGLSRALVAALRRRGRAAPARVARPARPPRRLDPRAFRRRTWVTRPDPKSDRLACAWLIRRVLDPEARFRFEPGPAKVPGAVTFDAPGADFTHRGEDCTFEVLVHDFCVGDPRVVLVAEVIHDIDVKDAKFGRPETPGFARLLEGLRAMEKSDARRIERALPLFDWLAASAALHKRSR